MKSYISLLTLPILLIFLAITGCGDGLPARLPVSGLVTLDGKPVPDAKITFVPQDGGRVANGMTDENGKFSSLTTFSAGDGVLIGSHFVALTPKEPPPMPGDDISSPGGKVKIEKYSAPIPYRYGAPEKSGLTAEVSRDSDNYFEFELKSK